MLAANCPRLLPGFCDQTGANACTTAKCLSCAAGGSTCNTCFGYVQPNADNTCVAQVVSKDGYFDFVGTGTTYPHLTDYTGGESATLWNSGTGNYLITEANLFTYSWHAVSTTNTNSYKAIMTTLFFANNIVTTSTQSTKLVTLADCGSVLATFGGDYLRLNTAGAANTPSYPLIYYFSLFFTKARTLAASSPDITMAYVETERVLLKLIGATDNVLQAVASQANSVSNSTLRGYIKTIATEQELLIGLLADRRYARMGTSTDANQLQCTEFTFSSSRDVQLKFSMLDPTLTSTDFTLATADATASITIKQPSYATQLAGSTKAYMLLSYFKTYNPFFLAMPS